MQWFVLALFGFLSFAISSSIDKHMMNINHHPIVTNLWKMLFDGLILLGAGLLFFDLSFGTTLLVAAMTLGLLYTLTGITYFVSLQQNDVGIVIPYSLAASFFLVFVASVVFLNEAANFANWIGIILLTGGSYVLLSKGLRITMTKGVWLLCLHVVFFTLYALGTKVFLGSVEPLTLGIAMYFAATIFQALYITARREWVHVPLKKIFIAAIFGSLGTFLTFSALALADASQVYPVGGAQAIFIFLIASLFLKEKFSLQRLIGTVLIVAGIALTSL